jgi:hypothetical protein
MRTMEARGLSAFQALQRLRLFAAGPITVRDPFS